MKKLKEPTDVNYTPTSFHNVTIDTTPSKLIKLCEIYDIEYREYNTGEYKTNFDFEFYVPSEDLYFTVYDWKEYEPLRLDNTYEFHIGTRDLLTSIKAKEIIEEKLYKLNTNTKR
jgi:hypothetical protein